LRMNSMRSWGCLCAKRGSRGRTVRTAKDVEAVLAVA
jgi:hypothetical protein